MWDHRRQRAFEQLKSHLSFAPVLAAPQSDGINVLDVDASDTGVGAVLQQQQEGQLKVIAFASRLFDKAERSYCTTRKELLACLLYTSPSPRDS